jgi:RecB family exonuclease
MSKPIVLNQSSLKDYLNCRRLYGWRRYIGLETLARRSAPEIGTAVHSALALFHDEKGGDVEKAVSTFRETLSARVGPSSAFEDKPLDEAIEIGERTFRAYVAHWGGKSELWTPLNQEVQFLVEVGTGTNVFLRGRTDNLSIIPGSGLYLVDYKTAGKMDPRDLMKYEMDIQLTAYLYGTTKQLTIDNEKAGDPTPIVVKGAIIDLLVKTKTPQFARELREEFRDFEEEFVEYGHEIRRNLDRAAAGKDWKVVFPKNTEHCFRYGVCPFRDVCVKDTPTRRQLYNRKKPDYVDEAQKLLEEGTA